MQQPREDASQVINIGSMDGTSCSDSLRAQAPVPTQRAKAAVHHIWTRELAVTLGPRQITVNAYSTWFFPSRMTEFIFDKYQPDIEENSLMKRVVETRGNGRHRHLPLLQRRRLIPTAR